MFALTKKDAKDSVHQHIENLNLAHASAIKSYQNIINRYESERTDFVEETNRLKEEIKTLKQNLKTAEEFLDLKDDRSDAEHRLELRVAELTDKNNELEKKIEELEGQKTKLQDVIVKQNEEPAKKLNEAQAAQLKRLKRNEYQRKYYARKRAEAAAKESV